MNIDRISIVAPSSMPNKVSCIKAIRSLTGLGLKEAKDASERPDRPQTFPIALGLSTSFFDEQCRLLRAEGFIVGGPAQQIIEELRQLGSQALLQGEDDLANEILQLVLAEKLRRAS